MASHKENIITDTVLEEIKTAVVKCEYDSAFDLDFMSTDVLSEDWDIEENGDWVQDYKYQSSTMILRHTPSNRFFQVNQSRSGSYHTDWYYSPPEFQGEVVKVEKMVPTIVWEKLQ